MPPYLYHIKLELYSSPSARASATASATPGEWSRPVSHQHFIPPRNTDIFKTSLPAHKTTKWTSQAFPPKHERQHSVESNTETSRPQSSTTGRTPDAHGSALLLPERNIALKKSGSGSPAPKPVKPSSEVASRDWRFGPVSIESIDMVSSTMTSAGEQHQEQRTSIRGEGKSSNTTGGLHTKGIYLPSSPKTTELGWGVVHLYRDSQETAAATAAETAQAGHSSNQQVGGHHEAPGFSVEDCTTLCILAVPSWMMPSDLLGFVGDQTREDVSHFRLIRTGRANKYMVLMKFRSAKKAKEWQKLWNGRLFSAMEPENCHVVFIQSVEFLSPSDDTTTQDPLSFPQNTNDPFTLSASQTSTHAASNSLTAKPRAPPTPSLIELPTCPVCLERMDETTGLLTILCQHVFHCACLEKWRGSGCPVCRYTQSPSFTFPFPRPNPEHDSSTSPIEPACSVCATTSNLWVCLICGNTGCGRYDDAHAYAHYEDTSHCYAMDISTQHVWDYAGDGYVHRLIQNKPDTAASTPLTRSSGGGANTSGVKDRHPNAAFREEPRLCGASAEMVPREKMDAMATEYTYLLTSQLDSQRRYYEEQLERAVDKASSASSAAESAALSSAAATASVTALSAQNTFLETEIQRLGKAMEKYVARAERLEKMSREMGEKWREEKMMNEGLMTRIRVAEGKAEAARREKEAAEKEKEEMEEMNRDLSLFISGQEKVRELVAQGEEVDGGDVGVVEGASKRKGKGKRK